MPKKSMRDYAKTWKPPEQRADEKREASAKAPPKAKGKDSDDSKGPGPTAWTKGMKKPKGGGC